MQFLVILGSFYNFFSNLSDLVSDNLFLKAKGIFIGSILGLILAYFIRFFHYHLMELNQVMKKSIILLMKAHIC